MTPQVVIGLTLVLVGLALKAAAAILQLPEIGLVGEASNLGMLLLGKELMQPSQAMVAKRSTRPPVPVAMLFGVALLLTACGASDEAARRDRANEYTQRVNAGAAVMRETRVLVDAGCAFIGEKPPCASVRQAYALAAASLEAAHAAIGIYDATGQGPLEAITKVIQAEADAAALVLEAKKLAEVIRAEAKAHEAAP